MWTTRISRSPLPPVDYREQQDALTPMLAEFFREAALTPEEAARVFPIQVPVTRYGLTRYAPVAGKVAEDAIAWVAPAQLHKLAQFLARTAPQDAALALIYQAVADNGRLVLYDGRVKKELAADTRLKRTVLTQLAYLWDGLTPEQLNGLGNLLTPWLHAAVKHDPLDLLPPRED